TRKPLFWIAFAALSAISAALAWNYFPQALPLVHLQVKMSRDQALAQAAAIAQRLHLAAPDAQRAAMFAHDGGTQNYVELEGGGKAAFARLLSGEIYSPYRWEVRLFKPHETAEVRVRFRPDGSAYGFAQTIPEDAPGAALDSSAARSIAEARARADWGIDFGPYKLLDASQAERPSRRIDHAFVYEREQPKLGDARIRLRLSVSGDALTEVTPFVYIPEAFWRRYAELRSANNAIARVASLSAGALFGLGGILGVLWLMRKRWLLWKPALAAGAIVAGLNALGILANAPQSWFNFDTAHSPAVFWGQQLGIAAAVLVGGGLALALVFLAGESLSRRAFPAHPQLWRLWSSDAAPTPALLGRTLAGYLLVPIELALVAGFYFVTNRYYGWWQPSETLSDPNILGSALPALSPIGMALQAGFMEESLFRAVPLSLAALIGERFGMRRQLIGVALVIEALVFAAAHANYPGFPAYSRLAELFVPALVWGLIFLRFGLLPTVILHALYDLTLMAIPVFLMPGPGALPNQALVVGAGLFPLAVVLLRRNIAGAWRALPAAAVNGAWRPSVEAAARATERPRAGAGAWAARMQRSLPVLGLAGLVAYGSLGGFRGDAPPLKIDRAQAEAMADAALTERGVNLSRDWKRYAAIRLASDDATSWAWHKFVWREAGADQYRRLVGNWLAPPLWEVRYARFSGVDVADRAEEWRVTIQGDGKLRQIMHQLPEQRPGARLSRDAARALAQREIATRFGLDPAVLREVEVKEDPQPSRTDWQFIYADPRVNVGEGGEARVLVNLDGDEVTASGRYIFIPETWYRAERERSGRLNLVRIIVALVFAVAALAALIGATLAWTREHFDGRAFRWSGLLLFGAAVANALNQWPAMAMRLQTTEPVLTQVALAGGGLLFAALIGALIGAIFVGVGAFSARVHLDRDLTAADLWLRGAATAALVLGINFAAGALAPDSVPLWPKFAAEDTALPWLARALGALNILPVIALTIVVLHWLDRFTAGWTHRKLPATLLLILTEAAIAAVGAERWSDIAVAGLVGGGVATLLFATVLRFDLRTIPALVAVYASLSAIGQGLQKGTVEAAWLTAIGVLALLAVAWLAMRYLIAQGEIPTAATQPAAAPE
ncbi:MAG TPA: type II CAAX endopeptidase family protein, partial [Casimicrobiaceae bacterium]